MVWTPIPINFIFHQYCTIWNLVSSEFFSCCLLLSLFCLKLSLGFSVAREWVSHYTNSLLLQIVQHKVVLPQDRAPSTCSTSFILLSNNLFHGLYGRNDLQNLNINEGTLNSLIDSLKYSNKHLPWLENRVISAMQCFILQVYLDASTPFVQDIDFQKTPCNENNQVGVGVMIDCT